jgi:diphthamide biosynthesis protein 3
MAEEDEEIAVYDEVEIEDMTFDETLQIYHYPCPCGDRFEIALADLQDESTDIAVCPSCSLMIRVIFDLVDRLSGYWLSATLLLTYVFRMTFQNPNQIPQLPNSRRNRPLSLRNPLCRREDIAR